MLCGSFCHLLVHAYCYALFIYAFDSLFIVRGCCLGKVFPLTPPGIQQINPKPFQPIWLVLCELSYRFFWLNFQQLIFLLNSEDFLLLSNCLNSEDKSKAISEWNLTATGLVRAEV